MNAVTKESEMERVTASDRSDAREALRIAMETQAELKAHVLTCNQSAHETTRTTQFLREDINGLRQQVVAMVEAQRTQINKIGGTAILLLLGVCGTLILALLHNGHIL